MMKANLLRCSTIVLLVAGIAGCVETTNDSKEFESQFESVRAGEADTIELVHSPLTDQLVLRLAQLASLRVLKANKCQVGAEGVEAIGRLKSLQHVKLAGAAIDDTGIKHLSNLVKLQILNLPDAKFSDGSLALLAANNELTLLRFGSDLVTDEGMDAIAKMKKLRFLHILGVPITDKGIAALQSMSWLESFYLDGNRTVTDEALSDLLQQLPELHFHRDQLHLPGDEHD